MLETVAADLSAGHAWCESPVPPHPKGALLDWDLVTVEGIWVKWTNVTSVPWDTEGVLRLLRRKGKDPFLRYWSLFYTLCNCMAIGLCSALKINQWLGCRAAQPMAGKPTKARQNGQGIWLYNAGIRQGSSGYFDWSDDWVLQPHSTAKYTVLVPYLREPSTFSIDTTLRTASVKTLGEPV